MRIPIDIIILNKDKEIIYIKKNLKPWRILLPKKRGYYTLEYPAGSTKYNLNEKIEF